MLAATPRAASTEEFEATLSVIYESMLLSERNGDYVEAENLQRKAIRYRKQWEEDTLADMADRFAQAALALQQAYQQDLEECNSRWTAVLDAHLASIRAATEACDRSNAQELQQLRASLGEQLPAKVKESYQLLNLREMEHHMSKQKDFVQAHLIQNRIRELYAQELAAWNAEKGRSIEQAAANLRARQAKERQLFNKRSQIQLEDHNNAWHLEKQLLQQRLSNNSKELRAAHEREVGSFKREFRTKGGAFSSKFEEAVSG